MFRTTASLSSPDGAQLRPWWRLNRSTVLLVAAAGAVLAAANVWVYSRTAGLVAGKSCRERGWPWTWHRLSFGVAPLETDSSRLEVDGHALSANAGIALALLAGVAALFERRRRRQGRFLQISTRDLLLSMAVVGAAIVWYRHVEHGYRAQREAITALRGTVGEVVDSSLPDWLGDRQTADGGLLAPFQDVLELRVAALRPSTDRLAPLAALRRLERLEFESGAGVADADLAHVAGLRRLTFLDLEYARIGDAGVAHLAGLARLEYLHLGHTRVSGAGMDALADLTGLEVLRLNGTDADDAGLARLRSLRRLKVLDLTATQITDDGLEHVAALPSLERLTLYGTPVTDAGLVRLRGLANLRRLDVAGTGVTPDGLRGLRQALPRLTDVRPAVD